MDLNLPQRGWRVSIVTGAATLALAFGACSGVRPPSSPLAGVTGPEPSASRAPTQAKPTAPPVPTLPPPTGRRRCMSSNSRLRSTPSRLRGARAQRGARATG